jgi:hypothetical protein
MAMTGIARAARLHFGTNNLRRPSDRLEALLVATLLAVFVAATAAAPAVARRFCQSELAGSARLHPVTAVLTQAGPSASYGIAAGAAAARWRAPDGRRDQGMLTTMIAPAIWGAPAGKRVRVWMTESGQPQQPPEGPVQILLASAMLAVAGLVGIALVLLICYWTCRLMLDRHRLAAWAGDWSRVEPQWTTRR